MCDMYMHQYIQAVTVITILIVNVAVVIITIIVGVFRKRYVFFRVFALEWITDKFRAFCKKKKTRN